MKIMRLVLPAFVLLVAATTALPTSLTTSDPKVVMGGGGSCQSFIETSLTQTFFGVRTGCMVDFTNDITVNGEPVTLNLQVVNINTPFTGGLTCEVGEGSPLNSASTSSPTSCTFSASDAITPGLTYSLSFLDGFPNTIVMTQAQTVTNTMTPEPISVLLWGTGLLGILLYLRRA